MSMLRGAILALALCGLAVSARADELTAEKAADIRTLFELTGASKIVDQILAAALQQVGPSLRNCKDCTERTAQIVEREIRQIFHEGFAAPGGLLERQVQIYHRHLSHQEIREILAFYRSPVGVKLNQALPAITAEGYQAGREWGQSLAPELRRRIGAALELDRMLNPPAAEPK